MRASLSHRFAFITHASGHLRAPLQFGFLRTVASSPVRRRPVVAPSVTWHRAPIAINATSADGPPRKISRKALYNSSADANRKISVPGVVFLIVSYVWSIILFIPMLIAHPFVMWRDRATRRFHDVIAMAWMRCALGSVRVTPSVINAHYLPPKGVPAVYVANHASVLDIFTLAYIHRRIKYLSKSEIFRIPIVGWAMAMAGNVALRRMNKAGQMEAYRKMLDVVKNGISLVVFPEGTRSADGKMRRFKAGAFRVAKQHSAPVVPITILGTRECMPSHALVPLRYPRVPISLVIHAPIDSAKRSINELRDLAFEAINSGLPAESQTWPLIRHQ